MCCYFSIQVEASLKDLDCDYERQLAVECSHYYTDGSVDGSKDGFISPEEIEAIKEDVLNPLEIQASKAEYTLKSLFVVPETEEEMFKKCDRDQDGLLSLADSEGNENCMNNCDMIENSINYICKRKSIEGDQYFEKLQHKREKKSWWFF